MKLVIFLHYNILFIYQVLCTLIYRRRSLYSFLVQFCIHTHINVLIIFTNSFLLEAIKVMAFTYQIARFMRPTCGPPGTCRPQVGPMLAPRTLLSGYMPGSAPECLMKPGCDSADGMHIYSVIVPFPTAHPLKWGPLCQKQVSQILSKMRYWCLVI